MAEAQSSATQKYGHERILNWFVYDCVEKFTTHSFRAAPRLHRLQIPHFLQINELARLFKCPCEGGLAQRNVFLWMSGTYVRIFNTQMGYRHCLLMHGRLYSVQLRKWMLKILQNARWLTVHMVSFLMVFIVKNEMTSVRWWKIKPIMY